MADSDTFIRSLFEPHKLNPRDVSAIHTVLQDVYKTLQLVEFRTLRSYCRILTYPQYKCDCSSQAQMPCQLSSPEDLESPEWTQLLRGKIEALEFEQEEMVSFLHHLGQFKDSDDFFHHLGLQSHVVKFCPEFSPPPVLQSDFPTPLRLGHPANLLDFSSEVCQLREALKKNKEATERLLHDHFYGNQTDIAQSNAYQGLMRAYSSPPAIPEETTIIIMGPTNAGKTAFINFLMGAPLLPSWQIACTVAITTIRYSKKPYWRKGKRMMDGSKIWEEGTPIAGCRHQNPENPRKGFLIIESSRDHVDNSIKSNEFTTLIEVGWNHPLLEAGVVIVDSPGTNEDSRLEEQLYSIVSSTSGVVYLTSLKEQFRLSDTLPLKNIRSRLSSPENLIFLGTHLDECRPIFDSPIDPVSSNYTAMIRHLGEDFPTLDSNYCGNPLECPYYFVLDSKKALDFIRGWDHPDCRSLWFSTSMSDFISKFCSWINNLLISPLQQYSEYLLNLVSSLAIVASSIVSFPTIQSKVESSLNLLRHNFRQVTQEMKPCIQSLAEDFHKKLKIKQDDIVSDVEECLPRITEPDLQTYSRTVVYLAVDLIMERFYRESLPFLGLFQDHCRAVVEDLDRQLNLSFNFLPPFYDVSHNSASSIRQASADRQRVEAFMNRWKPILSSLFLAGIQTFSFRMGRSIESIFANSTLADAILNRTPSYMGKEGEIQLRRELISFLLKSLSVSNFVNSLQSTLNASTARYIETAESQFQYLRNCKTLLPDNISPQFYHCLSLRGVEILSLKFQLSAFSFHSRPSLSTPDLSKPLPYLLDNFPVVVKCTDDSEAQISGLYTQFILKHPNILQPIAAYHAIQAEKLYLILPELPRTLNQNQDPQVDSRITRAIRISEAIGFLHSHNFIHRDVKPENILLNETGDPFLIDFGLCRTATSSSATICGTSGYCAPEILGKSYDRRIDIFSLGKTLLQVEPTDSLPAYHNLLSCMTRENPDDRPSNMEQVIEKLQKLTQILPSLDRGFNILTLDGGGVRGIIEIEILAEIERATGCKIWNIFHLMGGTSTGGILALALGLQRIPLSSLRRLYLNLGPKLFGKWYIHQAYNLLMNKARFSSSQLSELISQHFGPDDMLLQHPDTMPKVFVTSSRECVRPNENVTAELVFFRSYQPLLSASSPGSASLDLAPSGPDVTQHDAALATSSAPSFFSSVKLPRNGTDQRIYLDGGLLLNNPSFEALEEARALWPGKELNLLVSLGTGKQSPATAKDKGTSIIKYLNLMTDIITDSENAHSTTSKLFRATDQLMRYVRLNPDAGTGDVDLHESNPIILHNLRNKTLRYLRSADGQERISKICQRLNVAYIFPPSDQIPESFQFFDQDIRIWSFNQVPTPKQFYSPLTFDECSFLVMQRMQFITASHPTPLTATSVKLIRFPAVLQRYTIDVIGKIKELCNQAETLNKFPRLSGLSGKLDFPEGISDFESILQMLLAFSLLPNSVPVFVISSSPRASPSIWKIISSAEPGFTPPLILFFNQHHQSFSLQTYEICVRSPGAHPPEYAFFACNDPFEAAESRFPAPSTPSASSSPPASSSPDARKLFEPVDIVNRLKQSPHKSSFIHVESPANIDYDVLKSKIPESDVGLIFSYDHSNSCIVVRILKGFESLPQIFASISQENFENEHSEIISILRQIRRKIREDPPAPAAYPDFPFLQDALSLSLITNESAQSARMRVSERLSELSPKMEIPHPNPPISTDGNCFFSSIAYLVRGRADEHEIIRAEIVLWLQANSNFSYSDDQHSIGGFPYVVSEVAGEDRTLSYDQFIDYISVSGKWGNHVTVIAAAQLYSRHINILSSIPDENNYILPVLSKNPLNSELWLVHWAQLHYEPLQLAQSSSEAPSD